MSAPATERQPLSAKAERALLLLAEKPLRRVTGGFRRPGTPLVPYAVATELTRPGLARIQPGPYATLLVATHVGHAVAHRLATKERAHG